MNPLSIQLYTIREDLTRENTPEMMQALRDFGYGAVEGIAPGYEAGEFRALLNELGMCVSSIYGPIPTAENLQSLVDQLGAAGTDILTGGFWYQDFETEDAVRATADKLQWGIDALAQHGIRYAMHNHWMELYPLGDRLVLDRLVELVPSLRLELDIYWASNFGAQDSVEIATRFADRILTLHVKDGPLIQDAPMVALGQGKVDVLGCIRATNPEWLIVELDHFDGRMLDAVRDSAAYLKSHGLA
ncbi:MAG: TIM barrel protein [Fimbriimonadaceae bacterium]|nr:TIM barrel protein [Fimbriimonadaceae bacterium]